VDLIHVKVIKFIKNHQMQYYFIPIISQLKISDFKEVILDVILSSWVPWGIIRILAYSFFIRIFCVVLFFLRVFLLILLSVLLFEPLLILSPIKVWQIKKAHLVWRSSLRWLFVFLYRSYSDFPFQVLYKLARTLSFFKLILVRLRSFSPSIKAVWSLQ
jgi:hypothetical protein